MAQDDIQGQVVDGSGNPVSGAIVELTKSYQSSPTSRESVFRTTTDANGNYIFDFHPDGDGTTQEWHVSAYNYDGSAYVNSFNNPGVTADLGAIPDSVALQFFGTEYSAGDPTWPDDAELSDMAINGDPQTGTLSDGSDSVVFDGEGDSGDVSPTSELSTLQNFALELSLEYNTSDTQGLIFVENSTQRLEIVLNVDETFSSDSGNVFIRLQDANGNDLRFGFDTFNGLDSDSRTDLSILFNDATANDVSLIVDGDSKSVAFDVSEGPSSFNPWNNDITFMTEAGGRDYDGDIGAIRWHDEQISNQTINQY